MKKNAWKEAANVSSRYLLLKKTVRKLRIPDAAAEIKNEHFFQNRSQLYFRLN